MTTTTITEALTAITGLQYVRQHEDTITVTPADTQQISEILRYATENQLTVTPIGGATKQTWGNPVQTQIHLELGRLNRVLEHPWQDLTCTVQAGCTWQHLQETLAQRGQFVALDPLFPHLATVGGILSTNDSGSLRHKYGSLRDLVIGMTLVLPDGTIARSGGRVVKNVAGYDLCKLLTGSLGTLAIITEATFRLHPLPQHPQTFTVFAPQAVQLAPLMATIRASHLLTQALQLRGDTNGFHLDIQLNAHPEAHQDAILAQMAQSHGFTLSESKDEVWLAREQLCQQENTAIAKISISPAKVASVCAEIAVKKLGVVAQANGIMYTVVPIKSGYEYRYTLTAFDGLREDTDTYGGAISFHGVSSVLLGHLKSWPTLSTTLSAASAVQPLMQAIKHQFDPNRTLNPGRFLGGI